MGNRLEGKVAIVTGGGGGIGRGVCRLLAEEGASVVVNDVGGAVDGTGTSTGPADELVSEIKENGGIAVSNYDTIATMEGAGKLVQAAIDNFGRVDILMHVAGILRDRMVFNMTEEEWDSVIKVHLTAYFNLAKHASVIMRKQNFGRLIGFTSSSGLTGNAGQANYSAAKAGIAGMTRCLAIDLGRNGITANAIAPTAMTRMTESVPQQIQQGKFDEDQKAQRMDLDPAQIAPLTAYLCSEQAWDINGKIFYSSGKKIAIGHDVLPFRSINKPASWDIDDLSIMVPDLLNGMNSSS